MNPFSRDRYEYTPTHLYYLPRDLISKLEDSKPSYVIGSRGSGKTTLLRALNWEERQRNKWLNDELGGDAFRNSFIATYTKLPLIQIRAFQEWLVDKSDVQQSALFGYYFDLISTQALAHSLSKIVSSPEFCIDIEREAMSVCAFLSDSEIYETESSRPAPTSIIECHNAIRTRRRKLEAAAVSCSGSSELIGKWAMPAAGEMVNSFGRHMAKLLEECAEEKDRKWHFKCCYDEAECLDQRQLVVVNSIVRTSSWPVSYVLSFVGEPSDLSLTINDKLTLQKADRSIIYLDGLNRPEFEELCDGVANVRIQAALAMMEPEGFDHRQFKTDDVLGSLDLNAIVADLVKRSEKPIAKQLQSSAESFRATAWGQRFGEIVPEPYIEAYLADRLSLIPPDPSVPGQHRAQESREFRKKFVASYLSICRDLGIKKIPYAFSNMVFGISDTCVRDYLAQMHKIFEKRGQPLPSFLRSVVPWRIQSEAIHDASAEKRQSIRTGEEVSSPERVRRIAFMFGELTGLLQRGDAISETHIRSPERGLFHFGSSVSARGRDEELYGILKDASEAGFLRLKREGEQILGFKVHASMAPAFGFSYRGAYYPVAIRRAELAEALATPDDEELLAIARRVFQRLGDSRLDPAQKTLFSLSEPEELIDNDD